MVTSAEVSASPDSSSPWQSINWKAIEQHVLKLQMRIAKATREGKCQQQFKSDPRQQFKSDPLILKFIH